MKDWDYYRRHFIVYHHENATTAFEAMDKHKMTPIEKIAYTFLLNIRTWYGGYYFRIKPQLTHKSYVLDFCIEVHFPGTERVMLNIECDGHDFHEKTKEQASKDKKRDRELQKDGFVVLRYSGSDIVNNPLVLCEDITGILGKPEWAVKNERGISDQQGDI